MSASGIADPDEAYFKLIHPEKMRLQLEYVRRRSTLVDLRILFETAATLFRTRTGGDAPAVTSPSAKAQTGNNGMSAVSP